MQIYDMEDIERFIKIVQQKRLINQRELEHLDVPSDEHKKLMKELQDLKSRCILYHFLFFIKSNYCFFIHIYTEDCYHYIVNIVHRWKRTVQGEYYKTSWYNYRAQTLYTQACTILKGYFRLACSTWLCAVCKNFPSLLDFFKYCKTWYFLTETWQ